MSANQHQILSGFCAVCGKRNHQRPELPGDVERFDVDLESPSNNPQANGSTVGSESNSELEEK